MTRLVWQQVLFFIVISSCMIASEQGVARSVREEAEFYRIACSFIRSIAVDCELRRSLGQSLTKYEQGVCKVHDISERYWPEYEEYSRGECLEADLRVARGVILDVDCGRVSLLFPDRSRGMLGEAGWQRVDRSTLVGATGASMITSSADVFYKKLLVDLRRQRGLARESGLWESRENE